ncbi:MAG: galactokinase [Desulfobacterales bacterium]|nr:galactokinase [Desulfobacterales bacterium]
MLIQQRITDVFANRYGTGPRYLVRAPGRVNLIGEHTDYNDGFVLPMAIDRAIWIALSPRDDRRVVLHSVDFDSEISFPLDRIGKTSGWGDYVHGTAWALQQTGVGLCGWSGVMAGDVPVGAGLSSSAALEMAVVQAFCAASGFSLSPKEMAKAGQACENQWIGVNSGIMDQMISAAAVAGRALLIDCRSLETRAVPLPEKTVVAILDTGVRRGLVDSAYNQRRQQCEEAARHFGVIALRDVSTEQFHAESAGLSDPVRSRARHIVTENQRTLDAAHAMAAGDVIRLGRLMGQSHVSLRDDFEVSCQQLNAMSVCAQAAPGCLGARMTGGGFGGCAVALVEETEVDRFARQTAQCYESATGLLPKIYFCRAENGASIVF